MSNRLAVFNEDFIDLNLQWSAGRAKPVFYIGREQAELAAELAKKEAALPVANERKIAAEALFRAKEQQLANFKRAHARTVSTELRQGSRSRFLQNTVASHTESSADKPTNQRNSRL
nr:AAA family ATPase [Bradyrhizobium zhengyangense]